MDGVRMIQQIRRSSDEDVVHVDDDASALLQEAELEIFEDLIHHGLECTWRICQPKEHNPRFEKTIFGLECCLFLIPCLDPNVIIPPSYVKLGEDVCVLHLTDEIGNERQGVSISNSEFVQLSVILYRPKFAVL